jgi:hypothetical protein
VGAGVTSVLARVGDAASRVGNEAGVVGEEKIEHEGTVRVGMCLMPVTHSIQVLL